jgi:hypothetical protein
LSGFTNKLKEFIFKFQNNLLGLNTRVNKFNNLVSEGCTFCELRKSYPVPRETFLHLFFDCPETDTTLCHFENQLLNDITMVNPEARRKFWFYGCNDDISESDKIKFLQVTASIVMCYIWECKLKKCVQSFASADNFFFYHMNIFLRVSGKLKLFASNSQMTICRRWHEHRGQ